VITSITAIYILASHIETMTTPEEVPVATAVVSGEALQTHEMPVFSPQRIVAEVKDFVAGFRMTPGDWGSLTQLFFDNLSTLLGALFAVQAIGNFAMPTDISNEINGVIWGKIVPGVGFTLCLGNVYYSWMAIRLTKKYGRPYTAQPYGLNTPQAFAFVFNVMCTYTLDK
jgi:mannose/fructose/N-acetylgalactosamine-specific phosphotransferase system component IIC